MRDLFDTETLFLLPWRTNPGSQLSIIAQLGDLPSEHDPVVGVMNCADLTAEVVLSHNLHLEAIRVQPAPRPSAGAPCL